MEIKNFLPNGSVVLLTEGTKKLMIYGRKQLLVEGIDSENEQINDLMFDYIGVPYPEGYISQEYTYVFNHSDIDEVIFKGFIDDEEEALQNVLHDNVVKSETGTT